jgi:hypothetical protein
VKFAPTPGSSGIRELRILLKRALRDHGLRALDARELPPELIGTVSAHIAREALNAPARRSGKSVRQTLVQRSQTMSKTFEALSAQQQEKEQQQKKQELKQELTTTTAMSPPTVPETPEELQAELARFREAAARNSRVSFLGKIGRFVKGDWLLGENSRQNPLDRHHEPGATRLHRVGRC